MFNELRFVILELKPILAVIKAVVPSVKTTIDSVVFIIGWTFGFFLNTSVVKECIRFKEIQINAMTLYGKSVYLTVSGVRF